jgi:hypothetical protein
VRAYTYIVLVESGAEKHRCDKGDVWIPSVLHKDKMVEEIPTDGIFLLVQFMIIASHFGLFLHEGASFITGWLKSFEKKNE